MLISGLQHWNGVYFERSLLKSLGLRIQLGHPVGKRCPRPNRTWGDDFVIVDCDQIHEVGLDYCGCGETSKGQVEQLLERRFYPATVVNPKTAATFRVLEMFELLQYESKLSTYEFYQTVSRLTDNTGLHAIKVRGPTWWPETITQLFARRIAIPRYYDLYTNGGISRC